MQSSLRSVTPRQVTISSNPSSSSIPRDGAVQNDREISVATSPAKPRTRLETYSTIPPASNGHSRAHSNEPSTKPPLNRWGSSTRMSERSLRNQPRYSLAQEGSHDSVVLDANRDSMRALAEFLMTKEPPPNNWVSVPSDDERSLRSLKKSAFKRFGRQKKKSVPKPPRFMQLPDSAVAAKTREGARHIAISIPLEHDHQEFIHTSHQPTPRPHSAPKLSHMLDRADRGAVTVLKPVVELRESGSSYLPRSSGEQTGQIRPLSVATPPADVLGPEATRTLENYYAQLNNQQRRPDAGGKRPETARPQKSYFAVPPFEMIRKDSQMSDPRHSGGTIYSTTTLTTMPGHSRGVSSVSTAPSITPIQGLRLELPPRNSSKSNIPVSLEAELVAESARLAALEQATKNQTLPKAGSESPKSGARASQSPPTVFGTATAETAKGYSSVSPHYFGSHTPQPSGTAPTKRLPDLPEGAGAQIVHPLTAPPDEPKAVSDSSKRISSVTDNKVGSVQAAQQSRQERVKVRKQRDMAAIRAGGEGNSHVSIPAVSNLLPQTAIVRQSKERSASQDLALKTAVNTISPIMLVANLAPFTGIVLASDLPSPPAKNVLRKAASSNSNTVRTHKPPHSMTDSFGSDSDTIPRPRSRNTGIKVGSPNRSLRSSVLESHRQERRAKRNMSLHEKELDARLSKIEKDNAMLLNTLSGIANAFEQLNRLLPSARISSGLIENSTREGLGKEKQLVDVERMEPVMRELQGTAPRS